MSKSKGIVGTPVNFIGPAGAALGNAEGRTPGVPAGYSGTVNRQFEGDQSQQLNPRSGTPLQDRDSNPDQYMRIASSGRYGVSPGAGGVDMNNPNSNGNGVAFDKINRAKDYTPYNAPAMDSPVRDGKQMPLPDASIKTNAIRNGVGESFAANEATPDQLVKVGGVMSRD